MTRYPQFFCAFAVVAFLVCLSCLPGVAIAAPELPGGPVPVSEAAANALDEKIIAAYRAADAAPDGSFTLTVTDEEATSWFVYRVATEPENNIADPQIRFVAGKIHSAVTMVGVLPFELRIKLVALFRVLDGKVSFEIESTSAGFLPIPKQIMDLLPQSDMANDILSEAGVQLTSVAITTGQMTIQGHLVEGFLED